jgi:excisionase family DNA binding protein
MFDTERSRTKQDYASDSLASLITKAVQLGIAEVLEHSSSSLSIPARPDPDRLLSLDEAADLLGVSRPQIDRLVRLFGLPYCRIGAVKRIHRASLLAWAGASHAVEAA